MDQLEQAFQQDVERIQSLSIVPSILELICRTTGMGFAAVARVTEDRWIACSVRDEISFGLKPGGELQIETTICNEIRGHGQPVVIDEVRNDELYHNHHTPRQYGFQSYISLPIILKDGTFFGTLCAIDPRPAVLRASNMVTMFNLFADLISYHYQTQEQLLAKQALLEQTISELQETREDVRQYSHITSHSLQEPLRKLQVYTDLLATDKSLPDDQLSKKVAVRVNALAGQFSSMIHQLSGYVQLTNRGEGFEKIDLNTSLQMAMVKLRPKLTEKGASMYAMPLPIVSGVPEQLHQLFYHLLDNAIKFSRPEVPPVIQVSIQTSTEQGKAGYYSICIEDNGIGIDKAHLTKIFDLFASLHSKDRFEGLGMGLSQVKRIVKNHGGTIHAESEPGKGTKFLLVFPQEQL